MPTFTDIATRYDDVRLRLLGAIADTAPAGYRVNDARCLGAIRWRRGELDAARIASVRR